MTDLTADRPLRFLGEPKSEKWILDTSAAQVIYRGTPMMIDWSEDQVHVRLMEDAVTVASGDDKAIGIAAEPAEVGAGDPETTELEIYTWPTIIGFRDDAYDDSNVGEQVCFEDSGDWGIVPAGNLLVGRIHRVLNGYVYVQLDTPVIQP